MTISTELIVNIVFWGIPGFIIFISLLVGLKKGLALSFVNLLRIVVSVIIALVLTKLVVSRAQDKVFETAIGYIEGNEQIKEIMELSPEFAKYAAVLAIYLVAPFVFLPVYFVVSLIMLIPNAIVKSIIKNGNKRRQRNENGEYDASGRRIKYKYKKTAPLSSLWGMLVGIVCGAVVSAAIFMPFVNYIVKADEYYAKIEAAGKIETPDEADKVVAEIRTSSGNKSIELLSTASAPLFNSLTTYTTSENKKANVFDDLGFAVDILPDVMEFSDGLKGGTSDFTDIDLSPMKNIVAKLKNTGELKNVIVSVLAKVGKEWSEGGEIFGLNMKNTIPEDFFPAAKIAFDRLAGMADADSSDVALGVVDEFVDAFGVIGDIYGEINKLTEADFSDISKISVEPITNVASILSSDRSSLIREISAKLISDAGTKWSEGGKFMSIEIKSGLDEDFYGAIDKVLAVLKNTTKDTIAADLTSFADTFDTFGDVYGEINALSATDFNNISDISVEPLSNIADILRDSRSDLSREVVACLLSEAGSNWKSGNTFIGIDIKSNLPDGCGDCFDRAFELLIATDGATVSDDIRTFGDAISTFGKIYPEIEALTDTDFSKLEEVSVQPVKNIAGKLDGEGNALARGVVADMLREASTRWLDGEEFMGLDLKDELPEGYSLDGALSKLKESTESTIVDDLNSFADAIEFIKGIYIYSKSTTTEGTTVEEMRENLTSALNTLTPESVDLVVEVISSSITDSIGGDLGGNENNTSVITDAMTDVLSDIADLDEEDRAAEAAALNDIITYVSDGAAANAEPDSLVQSVVESTIIANEINSLVENERTLEVDEGEHQQINQAIDDYIANNEVTEEQQKLLDSLRSLFVIPTT